MLKILRRIVQEVNASEDFESALRVVVKRLKVSMDADGCNVFVVDSEQAEYVLAASEGLTKADLGKLRIPLGKGLVGLVGDREEPLHIADALHHPHYQPYRANHKTPYCRFLGVPLVHKRQLLGVLTVERIEDIPFDDAEIAFLVTLAAQLVVVIAHAKLSGALDALGKRRRKKSLARRTFSGISGAPGVGMGEAVVVYPLADLDAVLDRTAEDIPLELKAFDRALKKTREQLQHLGKSIDTQLPKEEKRLFDAYLKVLDSKSLVQEIRKAIKEGHWAQGAVKRIFQKHIRQFEGMDPYLAERAADMRDLGQRLLFQLQSGEGSVRDYPEHTILVGEEVTPSALIEVPESRLAGVVSVKGSSNAHVAILAKAMGVPTVMGVGGLPLSEVDGLKCIIDGYCGDVHVSPTVSVRTAFRSLQKEEQELDAQLKTLRDLPAETLDGHRVALFVNTGLAADVGRSLKVGAEGVGLYRTEIPFMIRERFPSEEEQRVIYRQMLSSFAPRPVMMRTLDVGGDKSLAYLPSTETVSFLGWRGIRVTLDHPDIFLVQLRAMLRASVGLDNLYVMLPMIGSIAEVEAAMQLLSQAHEELIEEGLSVKMPGVGVMVEVPAAVYQVGALAKRVDFLSVGSNDLTQYLLAVDRNDALVSDLYDGLHPAMLSALQQVVTGAHQELKYVSICGELAGDPLAVVLLLAMGFDTLSVSAHTLPRVKWVVRNFTLTQAQQLLSEVMTMDDPMEVRCHMELALEEAGLAGLIRAGK